MFKRRLYKRHNLSAPKGYFRMVRPLIKELITEEMLEMIQLTQGLISSVIQKSWKDSITYVAKTKNTFHIIELYVCKND